MLRTYFCSTVLRSQSYALTSMTKLALEVVHLEFLEDSFILIRPKVCLTFSWIGPIFLDNELYFPPFPLLVSLAAKLLWRGAECWKESLNLLSIAEAAWDSRDSTLETQEFDQELNGFIVRRGFALPRPPCSFSNTNPSVLDPYTSDYDIELF